MAKKFLAAVCALFAIGASLRCEAAGEIINLVPAIRDAGLEPVISFPNKSNSFSATNVFDGITWTNVADSFIRHLDSLYNYRNKGGLWIDLAAPESFRPGARFELRNYRLFRCPYWTKQERQPTEWKVYGGIPDDAGNGSIRWIELDSRSNGPLPGGSVPQSETNNFEVAPNPGFRYFRFVPLNSSAYDTELATGNTPDGLSGFDFELFELEYDVEVFDSYRFASASEIDFDAAEEGAFSPACGTAVNVETVFKAPLSVVSRGITYELRGYRLESFDAASGKWVEEQTVEGSNEYTFTPADGYADEQRRIVWLWTSLGYRKDYGAARLYDILDERGRDLQFLAYGTNSHENSQLRIRHAFDGLEFVTNQYDFYSNSDGRWLGVRPPADGSQGQYSYIGVNLSGLPDTVLSPDECIWLKGYRVCALSYMDNEINRAPTAWNLEARADAASDLVSIDTQSGIVWDELQPKVEGTNLRDFELPEAKPVCDIRFTPTASAVYPQPSGGIEFGIMELTLMAKIVNRKGTLRVYDNGFVSGNFSPALGSVCTESTVLTAPDSVTESATGVVYPCTGYRLERFDAKQCKWVKKESGSKKSVEFVPDPNEAYRLQWLVDYSQSLDVQIAIGLESTGNGRETISIEPETATGRYAPGTVVTVTAAGCGFDAASGTAKGSCEFVRWTGDLEGLNVNATQSAITFAVDRPRTLRAVFRRTWALDGNEISDGVWTFRVVRNPDGSGGTKLNIAEWMAGSGDLDLSTYVGDATNWSTQWRIAEIGPDLMSGEKYPERKERLSSVVLPPDVVRIGSRAFRTQLQMTNLVAACPNLEWMGANVFTRNTKLDSVAFDAPALRELIDGYTFFNNPLRNASFGDWNLAELRAVPNRAFMMEDLVDMKYLRASGTMSLPKAEEVREGAFYRNRNIGGIELGTRRGSLTNIASTAFYESGVSSVTIGSRSNLKVAANAFKGLLLDSSVPFAVTFTGEAPADRSAVDNILASITAPAKAHLKVSSVRPEWRAYVTPLSQISDDALLNSAAAASADGVWMAADGTARALVFFERMPLDPKGLTIVIR